MAPNEDTIVFTDDEMIQVDTVAGVLVLFKDHTISIPSGSITIDEASTMTDEEPIYFIPPIKDPECFDYYKKTNPEFDDKDKHTPSDFFPL
jgi:hypothetical protein